MQDDINYSAILEEYSKHPHDTAFKRIMSQKPILIPYLQRQVPSSLSKRCDWEGVELENTSFLDERFQERRCDLLVRVPYGKQQSFYMYVLFESQRKHDPRMSWRILQYMVSIWQDVERKRTEERKEQKEQGIPSAERVLVYPLPSILPIVFYNGKESWSSPTLFHHKEMVEIPPGMMDFTPKFDFILSDLVRMKDEDWQEYISSTHTYHCMKVFRHAQSHEIADMLFSMIDYLEWVIEMNPSLSLDIFTFCFHIVQRFPEQEERIKEILIEATKPKGEEMSTLLHRILKEGKEEGRQEGEQLALRKTAHNMLEQGADVVFTAKVTGLSEEEVLVIQEKLKKET